MRGAERVEIQEYGEADWTGKRPKLEPKTAKGCVIWPRTEPETEVPIDGLNLYIPPGEPTPTAGASVTARGKQYEIEGVPGEYVATSGADKGTIVALKRAGT